MNIGYRVCCKCGSNKTHVNPDGTIVWRICRCGKNECSSYVCYRCYYLVDKSKTNEYLEKKRKSKYKNIVCSICGKGDTGKRSDGGPDWRRDKYRNGVWDGKSYLCTICDGKIRQSLPGSFTNIVRSLSKFRIGEYSINGNEGKGIIGEAIIAKVRKLKVMCIETDNAHTEYDISSDEIYGIIQSKLKLFYDKGWHVTFNREHNFDTLFVLCMDDKMKNIGRVYAIPEIELDEDSVSISILANNNSKWEKFSIDELFYNNTYHDFLTYLNSREPFHVKDVKKWLYEE